MIHTNKSSYNKPISDLNKEFPSGFKTINFRLLSGTIKSQIISSKILQMENDDFRNVCSLLNFTLNDIHEEKHQLEEYQNSLRLKLKRNPNKPKRTGKKIKQQELDDLRLKPDLFNQNIDTEYNRIFPSSR